ncbi:MULTISPECIES: type II toxin-antitoxin system Phd/YefM family antitoxin [unclassified Moraxella]|uniref:type II toxin-antitoxin system Phd/YefM family antitoxin n=1 Tax=unclassified Moraxella TaxID=2685852 RepID=UPI003AF7CE72
MQPLFARHSASISELKRNPTALIEQAMGEPIVILNHNTPSAYLVPSETYERMMDLLDDMALGRILEQRLNDGQQPIRVTLDEL